MPPIIQTRNLSIGYGKHIVKDKLEISAEEGELICLIGTNGSGKSTLLRTLSGLQKPISGSINISEKDIKSLSQQALSTTIALVLTEKIDIEKLTVEELVAFGRYPHTNWAGKLSAKDKEIVNGVIEQVNLTHKAKSYINQISDGEKQRAVIAKALAQDTPLIMLDEPTAHLDLPNRIEIMMLLKKLSKETNKTFILSTHELDLAVQISDKIWLFTPENKLHIGIPEDLMVGGIFQETFGKSSYHFDAQNGHCKVHYSFDEEPIQVVGKEPYKSWVTQAAHRNGIPTDNISKNIINVIDKNNYQINSTTYNSIESLFLLVSGKL